MKKIVIVAFLAVLMGGSFALADSESGSGSGHGGTGREPKRECIAKEISSVQTERLEREHPGQGGNGRMEALGGDRTGQGGNG